jgi:hypothetical protein
LNKLHAFVFSKLGFTNFFTRKGKKFKEDMVENFDKIKNALSEENEETQKMLNIYFRFGQGKATHDEMEQANEQFRSMLKTLGLGVLLILPFAPLTLPLVVKLGKSLGIDVLPNSFKNDESD